jgi:hypothetical protein
MHILATSNFYPNDLSRILSPEEQNELDALDIIIGLTREERSYLLSVWRSSPTTPSPSSQVHHSTKVVHERQVDHVGEST